MSRVSAWSIKYQTVTAAAPFDRSGQLAHPGLTEFGLKLPDGATNRRGRYLSFPNVRNQVGMEHVLVWPAGEPVQQVEQQGRSEPTGSFVPGHCAGRMVEQWADRMVQYSRVEARCVRQHSRTNFRGTDRCCGVCFGYLTEKL